MTLLAEADDCPLFLLLLYNKFCIFVQILVIMKRFVFLFFSVLVLTVTCISQPCTPDPNMNTSGFSPDSITNLPPGIAGQYYEAVITTKIPADTAYNGISGTIDSIGVSNVMDLPAGLTWTTNTSSNFWIANSKGCLIIQGVTNVVGLHSIRIAVIAHGKLFGIVPTIIRDTITFYKIDMQPAGVNEFVQRSFSIMKTFPNPASDLVTIELNSSGPATVQLRLYNLVGLCVSESFHQIPHGTSQITMPVRQYPSGMYYYTLTAGEKSLTRKLNITR